MAEKNDEICTCECHDPKKNIMHFVSCCTHCDGCNLNIKTSKLKKHTTHCEHMRKKLTNE